MKKRNSSWNSAYKNSPWLVSTRGNMTSTPWRLIFLLDWWTVTRSNIPWNGTTMSCVSRQRSWSLSISAIILPWALVQPVPEGLQVYRTERVFLVRMGDVPGQTERQSAATSRSLFQHFVEWEHLCRRLPAVPESMARQRHEDHERVPDMVQQQRRRTHVGSHRLDVSV